MKKKRRKLKKGVLISIIVIAFLILAVLLYKLVFNNKEEINNNNNNTNQVLEHYNKYVITNKDTNLYDENGNEIGKISKDIELTLKDIEVNENTTFFPINDIEGYYIKYNDVTKIETLTDINDRYLNYIPFNINVKTNNITSFYDESDNLVYQFNESFDLPIIIKDNDKYGVEYNNMLLYIHGEDVASTYENNNTDKTNSSGVGVLNYHAFYDETNEEEKANCTTEICHSKSQFKEHLDFLKENDILTITMNELEMYIDGKLQLPKSVVITIDDGPKTKIAVDMLTEYEMYATIFLVTSWFEEEEDYYKTEYIELHSHSHDMHDGGQCPGGQGGAIKCLDRELIQNDLKQSREDLDGSTVFCFPFYEYNDYAIEMLKEAGFTMAFIGESNYSDNLVHVGDDKFKLRRFVIVTYTTMNDLENYFGQIS